MNMNSYMKIQDDILNELMDGHTHMGGGGGGGGRNEHEFIYEDSR